MVTIVIPARAGIQVRQRGVATSSDPGLRRADSVADVSPHG
jgi:hypothetical protein